MDIFVLNCGSSSLKYRMISMPSGTEILGGEVQRIGSRTAGPATLTHRVDGSEEVHEINVTSYEEAFAEVMKLVESDPSFPPDVIAHRLVHGGREFPHHAIISERDFPALEKTRDMAPLHNPPVIDLIKEINRRYPSIPQAIILDTAFHSTIPSHAFTYPLPADLRDKYGIRKYGFHGISHQYVSREAAEFLGIPIERFNAVSCHLGSGGASLNAIKNGKSIDNSMGFSPLQGLVMSTRSGDLDPALILKMIAFSAGDFSKVTQILNKASGVLGLSGTTSDIRDVIRKSTITDDERSQLTLEVYIWRIRKYLGAYLMVVGSADAIIFTDTIGESVPLVREAVCRNLGCFGVELDEWKNKSVKEFPGDVSSPNSKVHILVVKTNEELAIAKMAYRLVKSRRPFSRGEIGLLPGGNGEDINEKCSCIGS